MFTIKGFLIIHLIFYTSVSGFYFNYSKQPIITQITEPVNHGEGPIWDAKKNMLFFVDMHNKKVMSYNFYTKALNFVTLDGDTTFIITVKNNKNLLIIGVDLSLVAIDWDGINQIKRQKVLTTLTARFPETRFNDGKVDKEGRIWLGTMGKEDIKTDTVKPNQGEFYKITKDNINNPTVEVSPVSISNGLTWNAANNKFYYIDTPTLQVAEYDFDQETGTIKNRRVAFDLRNYSDQLDGIPDGMTIDVDDNLWVALYGGGCVIKIDPVNGTLLQKIALPAKSVTSAIWGGPNFDTLFVTTSRKTLTKEEILYYPTAGSVFAITNLNTKGRATFDTNIIDSI